MPYELTEEDIREIEAMNAWRTRIEGDVEDSGYQVTQEDMAEIEAMNSPIGSLRPRQALRVRDSGGQLWTKPNADTDIWTSETGETFRERPVNMGGTLGEARVLPDGNEISIIRPGEYEQMAEAANAVRDTLTAPRSISREALYTAEESAGFNPLHAGIRWRDQDKATEGAYTPARVFYTDEQLRMAAPNEDIGTVAGRERAERIAHQLWKDEHPWWSGEEVALTDDPDSPRVSGILATILRGGMGLGGEVAGALTDPSNYFDFGLGNLITREIIKRATVQAPLRIGGQIAARTAGQAGAGAIVNAGLDVPAQLFDIGAGIQEEYDPVRTLIAGAVGAPIQGALSLPRSIREGRAAVNAPAPETRASGPSGAPETPPGPSPDGGPTPARPIPTADQITPEIDRAVRARLREAKIDPRKDEVWAEAYARTARALLEQSQTEPQLPRQMASFEGGPAFEQRGPQDAPPLAAVAENFQRTTNAATAAEQRRTRAAENVERQMQANENIRVQKLQNGRERFVRITGEVLNKKGQPSGNVRIEVLRTDADGNLVPDTASKARTAARSSLGEPLRAPEAPRQLTDQSYSAVRPDEGEFQRRYADAQKKLQNAESQLESVRMPRKYRALAAENKAEFERNATENPPTTKAAKKKQAAARKAWESRDWLTADEHYELRKAYPNRTKGIRETEGRVAEAKAELEAARAELARVTGLPAPEARKQIAASPERYPRGTTEGQTGFETPTRDPAVRPVDEPAAVPTEEQVAQSTLRGKLDLTPKAGPEALPAENRPAQTPAVERAQADKRDNIAAYDAQGRVKQPPKSDEPQLSRAFEDRPAPAREETSVEKAAREARETEDARRIRDENAQETVGELREDIDKESTADYRERTRKLSENAKRRSVTVAEQKDRQPHAITAYRGQKNFPRIDRPHNSGEKAADVSNDAYGFLSMQVGAVDPAQRGRPTIFPTKDHAADWAVSHGWDVYDGAAKNAQVEPHPSGTGFAVRAIGPRKMPEPDAPTPAKPEGPVRSGPTNMAKSMADLAERARAAYDEFETLQKSEQTAAVTKRLDEVQAQLRAITAQMELLTKGRRPTPEPEPEPKAVVPERSMEDLLGEAMRDPDPKKRAAARTEYERRKAELAREQSYQDKPRTPPKTYSNPFFDPDLFEPLYKNKETPAGEARNAAIHKAKTLTKRVHANEMNTRVRYDLAGRATPTLVLEAGDGLVLPAKRDLQTLAASLGFRKDGNGVIDMLTTMRAVVINSGVKTDTGKFVDVLATVQPSPKQKGIIRAYLDGKPGRPLKRRTILTHGVFDELVGPDQLDQHLTIAEHAMTMHRNIPQLRKESPEFRGFVGETTLKNPDGSPRTMQIRVVKTGAGLSAYRPFDPIGVREDVQQTRPFGHDQLPHLSDKMETGDVYVRIEKPLSIENPNAMNGIGALVRHLNRIGMMSDDEMADIMAQAPRRNPPGYKTAQNTLTLRLRGNQQEGRFAAWLEKKGYDGLTWKPDYASEPLYAAPRGEQVKSTRNVGTYSPATYALNYSNPLFDFDLWKKAFGPIFDKLFNSARKTPSMRAMRKFIDNLEVDDPMRHTVWKAAARGAGDFSPKRMVEVIQNTTDYMTLADSSALRNLHNRHPDATFTKETAAEMADPSLKGVPIIQWLADQVGPDIGSGRVVPQSFQREAEQLFKVFANRGERILGKRKFSDDENRAIIDMMTGQKPKIHDPELVRIARQLRPVFDDMWKTATEAGLALGVRKNYVTRIFDIEAIRKDQQGFIQQAEKAYRIGGATPAEAAGSATTLLNNLLYPANKNIGSWAAMHGEGMPNPTRQRKWPAIADSVMTAYYVRNVRHIIAEYGRRLSFATAYARRFQAPEISPKTGERTGTINRLEVASQALQRLIPESDMKMVRTHMEGAMGAVRGEPGLDPLQHALSYTAVVGMARLLGRVWIAQLTEPMAIAVRENKGALTAIKNLVLSARFYADWGGKDVRDARELAEMFGIIGEAARQNLIDARIQGLHGGVQQALAHNIMDASGVTFLTERQRILATHLGQRAVRRTVFDLADGTGHQFAAQEFLADHGIGKPEAQAMAKWLRNLDALPRDAQLEAMAFGEHESARLFRGAVHDFANKTIIEPTAADTPRLAKHPIMRIAYALTSFIHTFTREVLWRSLRKFGRAVGEKGLTAQDRMTLAAPLSAYIAWAAGQILINGEARDAIFNPDAADERSEWERFVRNMSLMGLTGNHDALINLIVSNARYERDPTSLMAGPYIGTEANSLFDIMRGTIPNPANSPNTNNAEWQAAKEFYAGVGAPMTFGALAQVPLPAPLAFARTVASSFGTSPQAARNFATDVVGERTVQPRRRSQPTDPYEALERRGDEIERRYNRQFEPEETEY